MPSKVSSNPLRRQHRALVLGLLRADGPMPKGEVARHLGLSIPTVAEILGRFEDEGLVEAVGEGESSGGRRPRLFGLRWDGLRAVGVNVDHERISVVVSDLSGEIQAEGSVEIRLDAGQDAFVAALEGVVDDMLGQRESERLAGIGIALPTTIPRSGPGLFVPDVGGHWPGVNLTDLLEPRFKLPVVVENRARAVGVGEYLFGAARGSSDLLCLMLGTGLGGSVLSGGRLFTGGDGGSGVLGRMTVNLPDLADADSATVADLVGSPGIERAARERLAAAGRDELAGVALDRIDVDLVIDQAIAGDESMADLMGMVGRTLGAIVSVALCVTDSQLVLLCGPTMRAGELILGPFNETLAERAPFSPPEVRFGALGARAGTLGAAALVLTDFVRDTRRPVPAGGA